jgi:thioredoxin reductase
VSTEHLDTVVIGDSLAGISAALTLARSGASVSLLDFHHDTDTVADLPRIRETALGPATTGAALKAAMTRLLTQEGVVQRSDCYITSIYVDDAVIIECNDQSLTCKQAIFAPNGTEPGLDLEGSSALQGFGISYSATADAPYYAARPMAVYGDGPRLIEQAWTAAQYASELILLAKTTAKDGDVALLDDLRASPRVFFQEGVILRGLNAGFGGSLETLDVETATNRQRIEVAALFVAQHLVPATAVIHAREGTGGLAFAGLSRGVAYWDHAALVIDGARAARTLLSVRR